MHFLQVYDKVHILHFPFHSLYHFLRSRFTLLRVHSLYSPIVLLKPKGIRCCCCFVFSPWKHAVLDYWLSSLLWWCGALLASTRSSCYSTAPLCSGWHNVAGDIHNRHEIIWANGVACSSRGEPYIHQLKRTPLLLQLFHVLCCSAYRLLCLVRGWWGLSQAVIYSHMFL